MCFVNRKEKNEENDIIDFTLSINITISPNIDSQATTPLNPTNSIISATYSPFVTHLLTDSIGKLSIPEPKEEVNVTDSMEPGFKRNTSPDATVD